MIKLTLEPVKIRKKRDGSISTEVNMFDSYRYGSKGNRDKTDKKRRRKHKSSFLDSMGMENDDLEMN